MKPQNLRIPGPTPCPPEVLEAMGRQMFNHRGPEFRELLKDVTERLKDAFRTEHDVLIFPSSGTGGWEAMLTNSLSPGDRVLAVSIGVFGDRFADAAKAFGADVLKLDVEWGRAVDPADIEGRLRQDPSIKAVLVTFNETSTGVTNPLREIGQAVSRYGPLLLVDAVSGLGALPFEMDAWKIDAATTGSQKAWMIPPGMMMVGVGPRIWEAVKTARMPRYYFDFATAKHFLEEWETPYTPALPQVVALQVALHMMEKEGWESIFLRHAALGAATREGLRAMGIRLYADDACASNTVTAAYIPEGVDAKRLIGTMREKHNVIIAGGMGKTKGQVFRIGHMGWVFLQDITDTLQALEATLEEMGVPVSKGEGVAAARAAYGRVMEGGRA
jgi:aspartate aminotransferase-like enzyme